MTAIYVSAPTHVRATLYQERGLPTSEGKQIKNITETVALLETLPKKVAVIHCKSHPKGNSPNVIGKQMVDLADRGFPRASGGHKSFAPLPLIMLPTRPTHSTRELREETHCRTCCQDGKSFRTRSFPKPRVGN